MIHFWIILVQLDGGIEDDENGAPFAITIDHQTLQDDTVTIRDRDSMEQNRIKISEIDSVLYKKTAFPS